MMGATGRDAEGSGYGPVTELAPKPNGPALAAVVAGAFGCFVLGFFTTIAEASESLRTWLAWSNPVGPLTGKTDLAVAGFAGAWLLLGFLWRGKEVDARKTVIVSLVLIALGILGTFPTFFERFAPA
jgi:fluoride ion exporter CrcB/FEX